MGACSSCLGLDRRARGDVENPETSRLLHDDPYRSQYGTDQSRRRAQDEPDPTEMTPQEREAQQRICHAMSDDVVDVSSTLPRMSNGDGRGSASEIFRAETPTSEPASAKGIKIEQSGRANHEEAAYKSVKRIKARRAQNNLTDNDNWEAAKVVMG